MVVICCSLQVHHIHRSVSKSKPQQHSIQTGKRDGLESSIAGIDPYCEMQHCTWSEIWLWPANRFFIFHFKVGFQFLLSFFSFWQARLLKIHSQRRSVAQHQTCKTWLNAHMTGGWADLQTQFVMGKTYMCVSCGRKRAGRRRGSAGGGLFSSREGLCQAVSCSSWTPHPLASYVTSSIPPNALCGASALTHRHTHAMAIVMWHSPAMAEGTGTGGGDDSSCGHAAIFPGTIKNNLAVFIISLRLQPRGESC